MAIQQQASPGGLNQVARPAAPAAPAAPPQPPKQENLAARAAGMEQEGEESPQDYFTKTLEERRRQSEALMSQIERLKSSLDSRKGLPFDPVMMAGAAGFLKPTKTGSFGESLGYAAEGMSSEAEKEFARRQAMQKLELELAEKGLSATTKNLEMEDLLRMSGMGGKGLPAPRVGAPGAAPAGGPVGGPVGGPAGGPAAPAGAAPAPAGGAPAGSVGQTGAPNQMRLLSDSDITRAYAISKEHGDRVANIAKMQREDIISTPEGPFSRSQQKYLEVDPHQTKIIERDFGRFIGPKKVPERLSREYDRIRAQAVEKDDPEIEFNWFRRQGWLEGSIKPTKEEIAAGKAPTTGAGPSKPPLTVQERETQEALRKKRGETDIEEEKTQISNIRNNMQNARGLTNIAKDMTTYASSNPRAFQLLQDTTIKDAIFRAAEKGIQAGNLGSISLPTRELETYKLSPQDREALQMFMQKYAELTVNFRKVARAPGEGATTESEGLLFSQLGALPSDTARVIILKSHALELKAEYDKQLFRAWNKYRGENKDASYGDFLASDVKDTLDNQYDATLQKVRERNGDLFGGKKPTETKPAAPAAPAAPANRPPAAPAAPATPAAGPVRIKNKADPAFKSLPVGSVYIDVDGTVKRKKEGE
jgi:hypothetical protein